MRVLIAEDEPTFRTFLKRQLERMGHEVIECATGKDVLACLFSGELPQLLFLDWMMPHIDGLEVCQRIRERGDLPYTHIILLTSRSGSADIVDGLRGGANDYITKPMDPGELQNRMQVATQMIELNNLVSSQRLRMVTAAKMAVLGEMAGGIAHEINNPLAVILGQVFQLNVLFEKQAASNPLADKYCKTIEISVERIAKIVKGLHLFSAQGENEPLVVTTARSLFKEVEGFCGKKAASLGIELRIAEVQDDIACPIQRMQLCEVLLNLLQNSFDALAGRSNNWVELDACEDSEVMILSITDNGAGIPSEIRAKIMQPFFTTKPVGKGTGLGLSTSKGIIDFHRGTLSLDPSSMNTRFIVRLPKKHAVSR